MVVSTGERTTDRFYLRHIAKLSECLDGVPLE